MRTVAAIVYKGRDALPERFKGSKSPMDQGFYRDTTLFTLQF